MITDFFSLGAKHKNERLYKFYRWHGIFYDFNALAHLLFCTLFRPKENEERENHLGCYKHAYHWIDDIHSTQSLKTADYFSVIWPENAQSLSPPP